MFNFHRWFHAQAQESFPSLKTAEEEFRFAPNAQPIRLPVPPLSEAQRKDLMILSYGTFRLERVQRAILFAYPDIAWTYIARTSHQQDAGRRLVPQGIVTQQHHDHPEYFSLTYLGLLMALQAAYGPEAAIRIIVCEGGAHDPVPPLAFRRA
jgi:hypothetical protein